MTKKEAIESIMSRIDEIEDNLDYTYYGIRTQEAEMTVGEWLDNSYVWDDGEWTDEELDGTCATALGDAEILLDVSYPGEHIAIIGSDSIEWGMDLGEIIMKDAHVVETIC